MVANANSQTPAAGKDTAPLATRLSKNIAIRRHELGLTQAQLAERLGIDTETLSRFERGKHLPSLTTLEKLAIQLQTTIAALLDEQAPQADADALAMTAWLMSLDNHDRNFIREQVKRACQHLEEVHARAAQDTQP